MGRLSDKAQCASPRRDPSCHTKQKSPDWPADDPPRVRETHAPATKRFLHVCGTAFASLPGFPVPVSARAFSGNRSLPALSPLCRLPPHLLACCRGVVFLQVSFPDLFCNRAIHAVPPAAASRPCPLSPLLSGTDPAHGALKIDAFPAAASIILHVRQTRSSLPNGDLRKRKLPFRTAGTGCALRGKGLYGFPTDSVSALPLAAP